MKRFAMVATILLAGCLAAGAEAENLLKNGSFELGLEGWLPPSWLQNLYPAQIDTSVVSGGGGASLKMQGQPGKWGCVMQTLVSLPGGQYECSVDLKNTGFQNSWTTFLMLEYGSSDGKSVNAFSIGTAWNKPENDWFRQKEVFTLPEGTRYVHVYLMSRSPGGNGLPDNLGVAWFDNVCLRAMPVAAEAAAPEKPAGIAPAQSATIDSRSVNLVPQAPLLRAFNRVSWIKDAVQHASNDDELVFRPVPGKRGYNQVIVNPPEFAVEQYVFSVDCEKDGNLGGWQPFVQVEQVLKVEGKTDFAYCVGKTSDGRHYQVQVPHQEGLQQLRLILGTTPCPATAAASEQDAIRFRNPVLAAVGQTTGRFVFENAAPARLGGIYQPGEEVSVEFRVFCGVEQPVSVYLEYELRSAEGSLLAQGALPETLQPGSYVALPLQISRRLDEPGYYIVKCLLRADNNMVAEKTAAFLVAPWVEKPDPFFSMCHFGLPAAFLAPSRAIGMGSTTLAAYQAECEPQPGQYEFSRLDRRIEQAQALGMEVYGHFPVYGNQYSMDAGWYNQQKKLLLDTGFPAAFFEPFRDYARAVIEHVGNRVTSWSVVNEIDLSCHTGKYAEEYYLTGARIVAEEVRRFNPGLPVLALSVSGVDSMQLLPYAKKLYPKLQDVIDGIGPDAHVTPCTYGSGYRPVSEEKGFFREMLLEGRKMVGPDGILSIEEKGYVCVSSLPMDDPALMRLAAVMQRGVVMAKGHGCLRWVPHYAVANQPGLTDYGMWRLGNPRPMIGSYAAAARLLAHAAAPLEVLPMSGIYCYLFERGEQTVAVLWTSEEKPLQTTLQLPDDSRVYNLFGSRCQFNGSISEFPLFIETGMAKASLAERVATAKYSLSVLAGELLVQRPDLVQLAVLNKAGTELMARLSGDKIQAREVHLEAGKISRIELQLNTPLQPGEQLRVDATADGQTYSFSADVSWTILKRVTGVKTDAVLTGFEAVEPILLDSASNLLPYDALANGLWTGVDDLSLKVYLGYDDEFFHLAVEVRDDYRRFRQIGNNLWNQDALQFGFDANNDAVSGKLASTGYDDDNDWEYAFAVNKNGKPELYCYTSPQHSSELRGSRSEYPMQIHDLGDNRMLYRLALPWKALAPLRPEKGRVFGFNLIFFDDDGGGPLYEMGLSSGISGGKNPSAFRKFMFE
ncbi:MAG: hypothetical protein BWX73_03306 [Lentisphaerae bacterium ADurb.Bin082]|nr:MAG: hypothetical protein BWX73_03306 [Lentisphaerae bacterium ADurb.Bin082]